MLDPVSLAAILQQLQQQGGGGAVQNAGNIPPAQVSAQPPMQSPQGPLVSSPAATPPMFPNQGQDQTVNPLMQMAQRAMSNPQAQSIPQPPAAQSTSSAHPILAKIMQGLASGLQNYGYGMQTGPQQLERLQMNQQKSEALANLAATQAWREQTAGIQQQRANTFQEQAQTAQKRAETAEENVKSETAHRKAMEDYYNRKQDTADTLADARVKYMTGKLAQGAQGLVLAAQKMKQSYEINEQKVGIEQARTMLQADANKIKEHYVELQGLAISQRGTEEGTKATLELAKLESDRWFQDFLGIGGVGTARQAVQQATPMPGAAQPNLGVTAPAMPATGAQPPVKPTPQAKVKAKGGTPKPATPQSNDPLGIR